MSANALNCLKKRFDKYVWPIITSNNILFIIFVQKFKEPEAKVKCYSLKRSSAVAKLPHDASCRWTFCCHSVTQLKCTPLNSACVSSQYSIATVVISCIVSEIKQILVEDPDFFIPLRNNPRERTVPNILALFHNRFRSLAYLVVHLNSAKVFVYSRTNRETDGKAVSIAERLLYRNAATNLPMLLCGTAFAVRCVGAFRQIDRFLSERTSLYHSFWFD